MQSASDEDTPSGIKSTGDSNEQTIEYFLKQAHKIHNNEVKALKIQVKELKSRLNKEISKNSMKCPKCESNERSLEILKTDYEEQLNKRSRIICELKKEIELNNIKNGTEPSNGFLSGGPVESHRKKRRLLGRTKESPSSSDEIQILSIIPNSKLQKSSKDKEEKVEPPDPQLITANGFTLVPETLVDDMGMALTRLVKCQNENSSVVLETLFNDVDNDPSQIITNRTLKSVPNSTVHSDEKSEREVNKKAANTMAESIVKLRDMDLDQSLDDFQTNFSTKGNPPRAPRNVGKPISTRSSLTNRMNGQVQRATRSPPPLPMYKFHFSPARKGHRKPKFKQTTLTQRTFKEATQCRSKAGPLDVDEYELNRAIEESLGINGATSEKQTRKINDSCLDATFVPSQVLRKAQALNRHGGDLESENESPDSEDLLREMLCQPTPYISSNRSAESEEEGGKEKVDTTDCDYNFLDDFDKVPNGNASPCYKYKEDPVRKQDERRKLNGYDCRECAAYFEAMNLDDEEKRRRLKECSRHRGKHAIPTTPKHFWEIDFPSTEESRRRGVVNPTQNKLLRRRRPLN